MDLVNSLYATAAQLHTQRKFKDSFNTYVRASNAALVHFATATEWTGQDVTAKPDGLTELLRLAHQSLDRAEEIVRARGLSIASSSAANAAARTTSLAPVENDRAGAYTVPFPEEVPLIPISPVTQLQWKHGHEFQKATARYQAGQSGDASSDLGKLRRLLEDVRIQRAKVEELQVLTESVATTPITKWRTDELARQIAIVDAELFGKVDVRRDLGRRSSQLGAAAKTCIDFNLYLERVFIYAILSASGSAHGDEAVAARAHVLDTLVSVAHALFYQFRDLNGLCAILRAFESLEIRRLSKTWAALHSKTKEALRDLQASVGGNTGREHLELVAQILEHHYSGGGVLVVVPYLEPFVLDVEDLHNAYSAGMDGDKGEAMLSEIGARSLDEVLATLGLCQGVGRPDPSLGKAGKAAASRSAARQGMSSHGAPVPDDLSALGVGNRGLAHWLLTRVYWSRPELWAFSTDCEVPIRAEELPAEYAELMQKHAETLRAKQEAIYEAEVAGAPEQAEPPFAIAPPVPFAPNPADALSIPDDEDSGVLALLSAMPVVPESFGPGDQLDDDAFTAPSGSTDSQLPPPAPQTFVLTDTSAEPPSASTSTITPSLPPADPTAGSDYMDRYLGPLNEPFPGSDIERELHDVNPATSEIPDVTTEFDPAGMTAFPPPSDPTDTAAALPPSNDVDAPLQTETASEAASMPPPDCDPAENTAATPKSRKKKNKRKQKPAKDSNASDTGASADAPPASGEEGGGEATGEEDSATGGEGNTDDELLRRLNALR
ncbi:hypothetical protein HDU87_000489 [Geranomyces variabilis]|uniref:Ras-GEF domain-containing protein n=1 Tax=Geranomyces variabilis TaxID=109894 RepID=A0AAD5TCF2_9FUNG|nr:hypothetical protein HDU87_000489 [Geranomyces variabilis]